MESSRHNRPKPTPDDIVRGQIAWARKCANDPSLTPRCRHKCRKWLVKLIAKRDSVYRRIDVHAIAPMQDRRYQLSRVAYLGAVLARLEGAPEPLTVQEKV